MIKKGVYAAGISIINDDNTLNVVKTIKHAENIISNGLHGVFFFWVHWPKPINITGRKKRISFKYFKS